MATGACGVNCDVCKLKVVGACSTCGPGSSEEARRKLDAQKRILGDTCPILACAQLNRIQYCLRDCSSFPCDNFQSGPYPFSQGFLTMQERRRQQRPPALTPDGVSITIPESYWEDIKARNLAELTNLTMAVAHPGGGLQFRSLNCELLLDIEGRRLARLKNGQWLTVDDPRMELLTLLYLNRVDTVCALERDVVGPGDLKEAHYFREHHALNLGPLLERYGNDLEGFRKAAGHLDGEPKDMADAAFMLLPFPRVAVYFLLWEGDEEFRPKASVLFDRSIERVFSASAIWVLVDMLSKALLEGPVGKR